MTTTSAPRTASSSRRLPLPARRAFDLACVAGLLVVSYLVRRGSLPVDGLWFDDSWVAAGAIHGTPRQLLVVGSGHPGLTALLMVIDRLGGGLGDLGVPSLVAGVVTPPLLYLGLRSVGYERAVSALLGAALSVAPIHILYSGRVKGYTLDALGVLVVGMVLPHLARRRWTWPVGVAWVVASVALTSLSGFMLVALAGAGLVLALHPASDRTVRLVAVGAQAAIQAAYLAVARSKTDLAAIEQVLEDTYDTHMTFSWNPVALARELSTHLGRAAEVYPAGPDGLLAVLGIAAVVGLGLGAVRGRRRAETIASRYFLVLVLVAAVGSFAGAFPFGPSNQPDLLSTGGRHGLWLVPAFAFGLAAVLHRLRAVAARWDAGRFAFDGVAVLAAVAIVVGGYAPAEDAPFPGSGSAARFLAGAVGPGDAVIITGTSTFLYGIAVDTPVTVVATPDHQVGFAPVYTDPRIHTVGEWSLSPGSPREIRAWTEDADEVFVMAQGSLAAGPLDDVGRVLEDEGYTRERVDFTWAVVDVWTR